MIETTDFVISEMEASLSKSQAYGSAPKVFPKSDEKFENEMYCKRTLVPFSPDGKTGYYGFFNGNSVHASLLYGEFCGRLSRRIHGQFIRATKEKRFKFFKEIIFGVEYEYIIDTTTAFDPTIEKRNYFDIQF
jgi:hypothetical protein